MTFSDPTILVGLLALAIPLAIHLLGRRRARHMMLPTARFAEGAHQARRGLLWLKRVGLLALRLAAVALLVIALAGPRIGGAAGPHADAAWAICLDTSPSMATVEKNVTRYAVARAVVLRLLSRLREDEQVLLVRGGEKALRSTPDRIRAALAEDAPATWSEEPMGSVVSRTLGNLRQGDAGARLLVLTDATPWALRDLGAGEFQKTPADILLVPVGSNVANNRLGLPQVAVIETADGLRLAIEVDVVTAEAARGATVRMALDGGAETFSAQTAVGVGRVRFLVPLSGPGPWQGRVWMDEADALAMDNERFFTAVAPVAVRVLVVNAADGPEKIPAAAYMAAAFAGRDPIAPKEAKNLASGAVREEDLAAANVVFWVGSQAAGRAGFLKQYVEKGGSLVWIPAGAKAPDAELAGLAGAQIGDAEAAGDGVTLDPGGYASDLLGAFEGGTAADITKPVFRSRLVLAAREGIPAVRFADGRPAIVSRALGSGRVAAFAVGPGEEWGDLGARPEFVVLMHSVVESLTPAESPRQANRVIGQSAGAGETLRPGNFIVAASQAGGGKGPFSVNVGAEETADLSPDADRLASAFSAEVARARDSSQVFILEGVTSQAAYDATAMFVLPLALVVLLETLVISGGSAVRRGRSNLV